MKESLFNIHEVVLVITVVESLLLGVGVLVLPRDRLPSHRLLAALLFQIAVILACTLVVWNPHLQSTPLSGSVTTPALLAFGLLSLGPTLYLYMQSLTHPVTVRSWRTLAHYLPATAAATVILSADITLADWLPWNWPALPEYENRLVRGIWAAYKCQPLVYAALCCLAEYRLRRQLKHRYANLSHWELRWAELILGGFSLHWLWAFVAYWISGYVNSDLNETMGIISNYVTVALINGLFIFAMVSGRKTLILPEIPEPATEHKPIIDESGEKLQAIDRAITHHQLHLDAHINLERFSTHCGLRPREVSALINAHHHKNFFEFINYHRVEEVKRRLSEDSQETILDIALQSGFNSQSAFQRFFKRLEGITPSQYRRRVSGNDAIETRRPPEPT
ncbi:AraC family transcriptional regulator [Marinimicrobium agarilyticum]|uniref:AraC family transcriptional regulator n=1 Tax=Marinimicrobium agarilyticum TaxID=306546 RepID=UPI00041357CD|nr:helix-turn-helix domain-containing protein [Marinimicrobium agarilyticum]